MKPVIMVVFGTLISDMVMAMCLPIFKMGQVV